MKHISMHECSGKMSGLCFIFFGTLSLVIDIPFHKNAASLDSELRLFLQKLCDSV